jgi:hypothetical protein
MDSGTTYFFDFLAKTNAQLYPLFVAGCWASSWLVASVVVLLAAHLLARSGRQRQAFTILLCFLFGHLLVEAVRLLIPRSLSTFAFKWLELEGLARGDLQQFYSTFPSAAIFLSAMAWVFLFLTVREVSGQPLASLAVFILGVVVVFGGFVCNLCLSRHYLTDLLAGLFGGAGLTFLGWWLGGARRASEGYPESGQS